MMGEGFNGSHGGPQPGPCCNQRPDRWLQACQKSAQKSPCNPGGVHRCARGSRGWRHWRKTSCISSPPVAQCLHSVGAGEIGNHSAYKNRELRIEYPWHPLFGRVLHARDGGRRQGASSILVEDRPGFFRTLPPWMCDPVYCARLDIGPPLVALEALEALALTLELMRHAESLASSGNENPKEDMHAPPTTTLPAAGADLPGTGRPTEPPPGSTGDAGYPGGIGGVAADGGGQDDGGLAE